MTLQKRLARLEAAVPPQNRTPAVLVIPFPGAGGEPLVIGGRKHEYLAALRRLRGEEDPSHAQG
jgi:hypothetical protein